MPISPLQFAGALAAAAPLAESAVSSVSATFADLLAAVTPRDSDSSDTELGLGLEGLTGGLSSAPTAVGNESLRGRTQSLLRRFHQLLQGLMENRGIDSSGEFQLRGDAAGKVRVVGEHSDSAGIEELFAANTELRRLFDQIAANAKLLPAVLGSADLLNQRSGESAARSPAGDFRVAVNANGASLAGSD